MTMVLWLIRLDNAAKGDKMEDMLQHLQVLTLLLHRMLKMMNPSKMTELWLVSLNLEIRRDQRLNRHCMILGPLFCADVRTGRRG